MEFEKGLYVPVTCRCHALPAPKAVTELINVAVKQDARGDVVALTRTTTRSCHDPATAVSNFWWPGGVRDSPQRVPSAGISGRVLLFLPPLPVQLPPRRRRAAAVAAAVCTV